MTSSQASGTWNSYDLCFANCKYVIEDVDFEKAIALEGKSFTLNDMTVKETHDYYAIWVSAKGQTINIDGLTVESAGRGIKIDEQYVSAPAKVVLNLNDAKFKTDKKAAVVVKSTAGAEINASDLDMTEVAEDTKFAVWVDEDSKAYADKVVVNGAYVKIEGTQGIVVESAENLPSEIEENAAVYVAAGTYTFPTNVGAGATIVCAEGTVFNGTSSLNINGATVVGATFKNEDGKAVSGTINGTFKYCAFEGSEALRWCYTSAGTTSVFENCIIKTDFRGFHLGL
jgi:hypothetical protein